MTSSSSARKDAKMANSKKPADGKRLKTPRGQAMLEYSLISHFILIGGSLALLPIMTRLFEGISLFYDSVYAVIQTGAL